MTTARKTANNQAADSQAAAETVIAAGKETVENTMKAGQEAYAKSFDQSVAFSKDQFERLNGAFAQGLEDASAQGRDNLDAVVKASTVFTKGYEDIGKAWFAYSQAAMDQAVAVSKGLMTAKSIREAADLQSDYAKSSFDSALAEGTRLSEMGVKVTNEALAPINARVTATVEKLSKPIAA